MRRAAASPIVHVSRMSVRNVRPRFSKREMVASAGNGDWSAAGGGFGNPQLALASVGRRVPSRRRPARGAQRRQEAAQVLPSVTDAQPNSLSAAGFTRWMSALH